MPHNFNELIDASIKVLKELNLDLSRFSIWRTTDFSDYNDGKRGGKIRVIKILQIDKNTFNILLKFHFQLQQQV